MLYLYTGLFIIIAYLTGAVPFGLITAKLAGNIDIREKGSGNIGATNVGRILGKKWGIAVFILDFAKGFGSVFFSVLFVRMLMRNTATAPSAGQMVQVLAGLAAISGHIFPVYLKFKGGKGVATSAGVFCAVSWKVLVIMLAVWVMLVLITRYVSVASVSAAVLAPVIYIVFQRDRAFSSGLSVFVFTCIMALLVVFSHRSNIRRLLNGTENKVLQGDTHADMP